MNRLSEQQAIFILNTLFSGWQLMEGIDQISDTSFYRHRLKQTGNLFMPELEKLVDNVGDFFQIDVLAMNNLFEHKKKLSAKLMAMRPELQAGLNEILEAYFKDPQGIMDKVGIKITRNEEAPEMV